MPPVRVGPAPPRIREAVAAVSEQFGRTVADRDRRGGSAAAQIELLRDSGLLALRSPIEQGGYGESWRTAFEATEAIAAADASVGHLFAYHFDNVALIDIFASEDQRAAAHARIVSEGLMVANAASENNADVSVRRTVLTPTADGGRLLSGAKHFCSGAAVSDLIVVLARDENGDALTALVPSRRDGITIHDDWDALGMRQTDSGSITFDGVAVASEEVLGQPGDMARMLEGQGAATLFGPITQLSFTFIYLGIIRGALDSALAYTRSRTRPYVPGGVTRATDDPFILHLYGELEAHRRVLSAAALDAADRLDELWQRRAHVDPDDRGELAVRVASAKLFGSRIVLDTAQRIYDAMGARSTQSGFGFDRYWRDARTHTLHDPAAHRARAIGAALVADSHLAIDFRS